jgi:hypothetical protein
MINIKSKLFSNKAKNRIRLQDEPDLLANMIKISYFEKFFNLNFLFNTLIFQRTCDQIKLKLTNFNGRILIL